MSKKDADYWQRKRERMRRVTREFIRQCREKGIHPESIGSTGSMTVGWTGSPKQEKR